MSDTARLAASDIKVAAALPAATHSTRQPALDETSAGQLQPSQHKGSRTGPKIRMENRLIESEKATFLAPSLLISIHRISRELFWQSSCQIYMNQLWLLYHL